MDNTDEGNFDEFDGMDEPDDKGNVDYNPKRGKSVRRQKRPRVTEAWSDEDIQKLISQVEDYPCIWNVGEKDYKNRSKRESLRTQYRSNVATAKKNKIGRRCKKKSTLETSFANVFHWCR